MLFSLEMEKENKSNGSVADNKFSKYLIRIWGKNYCHSNQIQINEKTG